MGLDGWLVSHPPQEKGAGQMLLTSEDAAPLACWGQDLGTQTVRHYTSLLSPFAHPQFAVLMPSSHILLNASSVTSRHYGSWVQQGASTRPKTHFLKCFSFPCTLDDCLFEELISQPR